MERDLKMMMKTNERYTGVSLNKELMRHVKEHVSGNPMYSSATDFVRCAVREKLERTQDDRKAVQ